MSGKYAYKMSGKYAYEMSGKKLGMSIKDLVKHTSKCPQKSAPFEFFSDMLYVQKLAQCLVWLPRYRNFKF